MRRRLFGPAAATAALGLLGTLTLTGCGTSAGTGSGTTLRLVAAEYGDTAATSSKAYWDEVTKAFHDQNPDTTVEVKLLPWTDVDREVTRMVKDGDAPDMALMGAYSDFAVDGELYGADELLSVSAEANFLPPLSEAGSIGSRLYGLPWVASSRLLFYNKSLFREAGIDGTPKTWSDLKADAKALRSAGVKYPYALPLGPEEAHAESMIWELSNGGGWADSSGGYNIASDANVQTFKWIRDNLVRPGLTGPGEPAAFNRQDAFDAFLRGDVGMLNGYPSLSHEAAKRGISVGAIEMPQADWLAASGETPPTFGVADWMVAFKENGNREPIGKFLDFLYADKNLEEFAGRYHLLPSTVTAGRDSKDTTADGTDAQFLTALRGAQLYPVNSPSWLSVSDTIKRNIGRAVAPDADPKRVLEDIAEKARSAARG
ncbi:extracellular solute-binding protein [Streptomyces sp. NPDC093225]|uniref:extracellular solute-binding protein n=1 Tax=Streptomyces sp. NPDC093225 TaxID=3366034 RepID=UPI0038043F7F